MSADRSLRRATLGTLLAATATIAFGVTSAVADPAATVGIGAVRHYYFTDRGMFGVPAWTDAGGAQVNSVSVNVRDGDQVVATVPLTADPDISGVWEPAAPLELTAEGGTIPQLGEYALDATATDSAGNTVTRSDAGTLDFRLTPEFMQYAGGEQEKLTAVSANHRQTAVSGVLLGVEPGSGKSVPLPGRTVTVTQAAAGQDPAALTAPTGSDGSFTSPTFTHPDDATYTSTFSEISTQVDGAITSAAETPPINVATVYVTAKVNRAKADPGQRITISGIVRSGHKATAPPVAGVPVALSLSGYPSAPVTVTTTSKGTFSGSVVAIPDYGSEFWSATPQSYYFYGDAVEGNILVPDESLYRGAGISLASDGVVRAHGLLQLSYDPDAGEYQQKTLLEYSKNGTSGWRTLATVRTSTYEVAKLHANGFVSGYYRLEHPSSDQLAAAATKPVQLSRTLTRVAGNNASPEPVKVGKTITVTGVLQQLRSKWQAMPRQPIGLFFEPRGGHTFAYVTSGRTDEHGRAALRTKATKDGSWVLHYFGDGTHFDSSATADYVNVR